MPVARGLPRVQKAFGLNLVPNSGGGGGGGVIIDGQPSEPGREPSISLVGVTPHFHRTLGVEMTEGRDFSDAEGWSDQPLAIINKTMATPVLAEESSRRPVSHGKRRDPGTMVHGDRRGA